MDYIFRPRAPWRVSHCRRVNVQINAPPSGGTLTIEPARGSSSDNFALATDAQSWQDEPDDWPLQYRFGYIDPRSRSAAFLSDPSWATVRTLNRLPPGIAPDFIYPVFVEAIDAWGAAQSLELNTTVHEAANQTSDATAAMNLQDAAMSSDRYAVFHVVDVLALQDPSSALAAQMAETLLTAVNRDILSSASASRIIRSTQLLSAVSLPSSATLDCINILNAVALCTRRSRSTALACTLPPRSTARLSIAVSNLWHSLQLSNLDHVSHTRDRRLAAGTLSTLTSSSDALVDLARVIAVAEVQRLAVGDTAKVQVAAFTMVLHRLDEVGFRNFNISYATATPARLILTLPHGHVVRGVMGAVMTVYNGLLPFFEREHVYLQNAACSSQLVDTTDRNETRWHKQGIYRTCAGLPARSAATVAAQFLSVNGSLGAVPHGYSSPFVVDIPTDPDVVHCIDTSSHRANGTLNCSRRIDGQWT